MNLINNKKIKIPTSHYIGFQNLQEDTPLGLITAEGNDLLALRRKAAVDRWSKNSCLSKILPMFPSKIINNVPMNGFRLERNPKCCFGSNNGKTKWRIEDPRGFQVEITNVNLAYILSTSVIENGEILGKCIWGELGVNSVLIPVSSDVYKNAVDNTSRFNKHVSLRNLSLGNKVITKNGFEGTFLGSYFPVSKGHKKEVLEFSGRKRAFIANLDPVTQQLTSVVMSSSLEISEIIDKSVISKEDSIRTINQLLRQQQSDSYIVTIGVVDKLSITNKITLNFIQRNLEYFKTNHNNVKKMLIKHPDERFGIASTYDLNDYNVISAKIININKLRDESVIEYNCHPLRNRTSHLFSHSSFETEHFFVDLASKANFEFFVIEAVLLNDKNVELMRVLY